MAELSYFLELKKRNGHSVIIFWTTQYANTVFDTSWEGKFTTDVLKEIHSHRKEIYVFGKLISLLRLFRNIMSHHNKNQVGLEH